MRRYILLVILFFLVSVNVALATDFESASFNDSDPVITFGGGLSTSTNFQLISGIGQTVIGESTGSVFTYRSGFLYFPVVTAPILGGTAGDTQAGLTWSAAVGSLGANVTAYQVGQSLNSGGPFSYTNVGNVLSSLVNGLTNGTTYYFVVRALDAFSQPLISSSVVSVTPSGATNTPGVGGGGGGGGEIPALAILEVTGETAPNSVVTILRDGVLFGEINSGVTGIFSRRFNEAAPGQSVFTFFSTDSGGNRSAPATMILNLISGQIVSVGYLILSPSVSSPNAAVKQGEKLDIIGNAAPGSDITIFMDPDRFIAKTKAGEDGKYNIKIDTKILKKGAVQLRAKAEKKGQVSEWSFPLNIIIGDKTTEVVPASACELKADFNSDCRVNIVDFSILMYWFYRSGVPAGVDLSPDGAVNLRDFSILIYYWTG